LANPDPVLPEVTIYTDGGADPNPGYGGWAALLLFGEHEKVLTGNAPETTNNRMELEAAWRALQALTRPCLVHLYTDSQYLQKGITTWLPSWQAKNWLKNQKTGEPIPNAELWQALAAETSRHQITWHWVRGHAGNTHNERVDELATSARLAITPPEQLSELSPRLFVRASCLGNPGPGGWGAVLLVGRGEEAQKLAFSGNERRSSSNRMELQGVLAGLAEVEKLLGEGEGMKRNTAVQIITTSDYVYQGATQWLPGWRRQNWRKKDGQPIANADLWQTLDEWRTGEKFALRWFPAKKLGDPPPPPLAEAQQLAVTAAKQAN
jgi:ribonuclease HI